MSDIIRKKRYGSDLTTIDIQADHISISAPEEVKIDAELILNEVHIYDLIAEICKITNGDEAKIAEWLTSNDPKKREFSKKYVETNRG